MPHRCRNTESGPNVLSRQVKMLLATLLVLATLAGAGLYWLSGNINRLAKNAIESYGSAMTLGNVKVGSVKIAAANGQGTISNLVIGNPPGFKTTHAMKLGRLAIDIDISSITNDVIHIRRIAIVAPEVIYEKGDVLTNFDAIQVNIGTYLGPDDNDPNTPMEKKGGKRLIVDELTVREAKAEASAAFMNGKTVRVALPDITLKDIGKAEGGITPGELGQRVVGALKARLSGAVSFDRLIKSTGEAINRTGQAIKGLFK